VWWCSQGRNFAHEYSVAFIWAPIREGGGKLHRWDAVANVRRNDFLLSRVRQEFIAIGQATSEPVVRPRPLGNISGGSTVMNGFGVDVGHTLVEPRIKLTDIPRDVLIGLPGPKAR